MLKVNYLFYKIAKIIYKLGRSVINVLISLPRYSWSDMKTSWKRIVRF